MNNHKLSVANSTYKVGYYIHLDQDIEKKINCWIFVL